MPLGQIFLAAFLALESLHLRLSMELTIVVWLGAGLSVLGALKLVQVERPTWGLTFVLLASLALMADRCADYLFSRLYIIATTVLGCATIGLAPEHWTGASHCCTGRHIPKWRQQFYDYRILSEAAAARIGIPAALQSRRHACYNLGSPKSVSRRQSTR